MTLRQLQYALAVAEESSFTRAAARLHVSQPSLSQQIRALEGELGGDLFERRSGSVSPTPAGQALLAEARVAVISAERAGEAARRAMRLELGHLSVATVRSLAVSHLPASLERWHVLYPGVPVRLHEYAHRNDVEDAVLSRVAEIGVGPRPGHWDGLIVRLGWDELVVVLPVRDPLLQSPGPVSLRALSNRDWVLFEPEHGLAELVSQACKADGFTPRPFVHTAQVDAAARLAAAGIGPALVPIDVIQSESAPAIRRLDPPVVWEVAAFTTSATWSDTGAPFLEVLAQGDWQRRRPRGARVLLAPPLDGSVP
jgi:DNA-binding transcriptional LysR family regulator